MSRSGTILTTVAGVLLVMLPTGPPASGAGGGGAPAPGGPTYRDAHIRVATYNVEYATKAPALVEDVGRLMHAGVSVISLQEMGGRERRDALRAALLDCDPCRYQAYMPEPGGPAVTPILYRSDRFDLIGSGTTQVTEQTEVGTRGAGPSTVPPKYVDQVLLRERTSGRRIAVLNTHLVASVQAKDGGSNPRMAKRLEVYRQHLRGLRRLVTALRQTGTAVVVTGDFNVNYRRDKVVQDPIFPFVQLHRVEASASYETLGEPALGTHTLPSGFDTRLIDYVYLARHGAVTPVAQRVLQGFHSDHRPLVVRFGVDARRRAPTTS